jgi:hypothetical protein
VPQLEPEVREDFEVTPLNLLVGGERCLMHGEMMFNHRTQARKLACCSRGPNANHDRLARCSRLIDLSEPVPERLNSAGSNAQLPRGSPADRLRPVVGDHQSLGGQLTDLAIDLLMGRAPEVADGAVESTGQFDPRGGSLGEGGQDRKAQGQDMPHMLSRRCHGGREHSPRH